MDEFSSSHSDIPFFLSFLLLHARSFLGRTVQLARLIDYEYHVHTATDQLSDRRYFQTFSTHIALHASYVRSLCYAHFAN